MKISTSNVVKGFCAILLLGILVVSCQQDPIFHIISTETAPIPPRIEGAPTNMVVFERGYLHYGNPTDPDFDPDAAPEPRTIPLLFVASGRLHWYGKPKDTDESPRWDRNYGIPQPRGKIIALAVTRDYLYALCLSSSSLSATLRRIGHDDDAWQDVINEVSDYSLIQSIYSTYSDGDSEEGQLFAGARKRSSDTYALLYLDETSDTLKMLKDDTEMLSGAACRDNTYYLCTRGKGIFQVSKDNLTIENKNVLQLFNIRKEVKIEPKNSNSDDSDNPDDSEPVDPEPVEPEPMTKPYIQERNNARIFMGMIKLENDSIIVIERDNGTLYEILTNIDLDIMLNDITAQDPLDLFKKYKNGRAFSQMFQIDNEDKPIQPARSITTGGYAMSALTLWQDPKDPSKKLLVAGRQGTLYSTSYNNGYIEFNLNPNGSFNKKTPTSSMFIVHDTDRYSTSLEKHPINYLFQTPDTIDPNMTFFASTQTGGLWSYRDRSGNGGWQWNAED